MDAYLKATEEILVMVASLREAIIELENIRKINKYKGIKKIIKKFLIKKHINKSENAIIKGLEAIRCIQNRLDLIEIEAVEQFKNSDEGKIHAYNEASSTLFLEMTPPKNKKII